MSELHSFLLVNHLIFVDINVGFQAEWSIEKQGFVLFKYDKTRSESGYYTLRLVSLRVSYKTI